MSKGKAQSYEDGVTKSNIVLLIADNGEQDRTDISRYLNKQYGLTSPNNVKRHLYDLVSLGILENGVRKPGGSTPYKLKDGFDGFKIAFNFLKDRGFTKEFMKTRYYNDCLDSPEMQVKMGISVLRDTALNVHAIIKADETYNKLMREIEADKPDPQDVKKVLDFINGLRGQEPTEESEMALKIIEMLETGTIDDLYEYASSMISLQYQTDISKDSQAILMEVGNTLLPENEKTPVLNMLRSSPSAIDFILNLRDHSPYNFTSSILRYFMMATISDKEKMRLIENRQGRSGKQMGPKDSDTLLGLFGDYSKVVSESPIIQILRSEFMIDYVNGNIIENEFAAKTLDQLFTPKIDAIKQRIP